MSVTAVTALLISFVDSAEVRDRLIVLGPHHTGTSIVAKALDGFGFHLGDAKDLLLRQDNPLKYWERRDVVDLNNARISSAGLNRTGVPSFVGYGFEPTQGLPLDPSSIIATLDGSGKSWATKDPRLSLTASEWLPRLTKDHRRPAPVCILTVRHPLGFASTMMRYSSSLGLAHWGSIWMRYMTEALRACTSANVSIALVSHSDLVHRPLNALVALQTTLGALGVRLPSLVPASVIAGQLLDLGLGSAPAEPEWLPSELAALPEGALSLYVAIYASLFSSAPLPRPSMHPWMALPPAKRKAREAYATLLTTSDEVYLAGAITLGTSIRAFDTLRELLALVTPAVPVSWHDELRAAGFEVVSVDEIEEFWWGKGHERCRSYDPDQDARWGHESTKLRLWELEQYDALLYIDADGLLLGPADGVFGLHGFAAERGLSGPWFNAGVMLIRPSQQTFAGLIARGASTPPTIFNNVVDCTEQGLLNAYFDGSDASRAVQLFDVVHPHDPGGAAVKTVVHWITLQCPKPWDHEPGRLLASVLPAECSRPLYGYWWRLYNRTGADVLGQSPGLRRTAPRKLQNEYEDKCSKNCPHTWLADGMCDRNCDNEECAFDHGDCSRNHRPSSPPPPPRPPPAPRPPPMPPLAPRSGCDCSVQAMRTGGASGAVQRGCFAHDSSHVCYTVGRCDRPSGNPSARYPGVYWRHCIVAPPSPRWHYINPPQPPPPPIPSQRVVGGGGGAPLSCPDECSKRVGNGHCHTECYTAECEWDGGDCEDLTDVPSKCAERCPPKLHNNRECDEECNVEACMFDGNDCDHGHTECYKDPHGKDYRGSINSTDDGTECKVWDAKSFAKYVDQTQSGLGGHNHCRNPTTAGKTYGSKPVDGDRPWCWRKRDDFNNAGENWGYCDVQKPSKVCGDQSISGKIDHALSELSNEATAAPLIAAILSIASVLLLGLLVFVYRMLKVWHAHARDSKAVGVVTSLTLPAPLLFAAAHANVRDAAAATASLSRT